MQFKALCVLALGATLAAATVTPVRAMAEAVAVVFLQPVQHQLYPVLQQADSAAASKLLGLLCIVLQDVTALVGLNCSPRSVIGIGGNSCTAQPVCCTNNSFSGLIALGCTPININL